VLFFFFIFAALKKSDLCRIILTYRYVPKKIYIYTLFRLGPTFKIGRKTRTIPQKLND
jgi:hypothetical protein